MKRAPLLILAVSALAITTMTPALAGGHETAFFRAVFGKVDRDHYRGNQDHGRDRVHYGDDDRGRGRNRNRNENWNWGSGDNGGRRGGDRDWQRSDRDDDW